MATKPKITPVTKSGLPSRIECTKCGAKKGVRPDVMEKRIAKFGSLEKLIKIYVCRDCKKVHNLDAGFRIKPAKRAYHSTAAMGEKYKSIDPADGAYKYFWDHAAYEKAKWLRWADEKLTSLDNDVKEGPSRFGPACHRPDVFLDNNRFCGAENGTGMCPIYNKCDCPLKKLAKYPKLIETNNNNKRPKQKQKKTKTKTKKKLIAK